MLKVLENCFPEKMKSLVWQEKLKRMIPSHGQSLTNDAALHDRIQSWTREVLQIQGAVEMAA